MNNNTNFNNMQFDPMTGQPINQQPRKKVNTRMLIIIAIIITVIIVGIIFFSKLLEEKGGENIPAKNNNTNTTYDENGAFLLRIEDVFTITGRGTVVTGKVERGTIKMNDEVQIIGLDKEIITTIVTGIEMFRSTLDQATVGDNVGILLRGVKRDQVQKGQVVAKPNSISAVKKFEANLSVISTEDGGRGTPFFDGFSPKFYFLTDISGTIKLPKDKEMVKPGENVVVTVTLEESIAMEVGTEFTIREGGRIIANGKVTKVY